jgi:hypothetical protein
VAQVSPKVVSAVPWVAAAAAVGFSVLVAAVVYSKVLEVVHFRISRAARLAAASEVAAVLGYPLLVRAALVAAEAIAEAGAACAALPL